MHLKLLKCEIKNKIYFNNLDDTIFVFFKNKNIQYKIIMRKVEMFRFLFFNLKKKIIFDKNNSFIFLSTQNHHIVKLVLLLLWCNSIFFSRIIKKTNKTTSYHGAGLCSINKNYS